MEQGLVVTAVDSTATGRRLAEMALDRWGQEAFLVAWTAPPDRRRLRALQEMYYRCHGRMGSVPVLVDQDLLARTVRNRGLLVRLAPSAPLTRSLVLAATEVLTALQQLRARPRPAQEH